MRRPLRSLAGDYVLLAKSEVLPTEEAQLVATRTLLWELEAWMGQRSARSTLDLVYRDLFGSPSDASAPTREVDRRVHDRLADAIATDRLVALKTPRRTVPIPATVAPLTAPELGPGGEEAQSNFEVKLVDEVGDPLANVAVSIDVDGKKQKTTTSGAGIAKVKGIAGVATLTFDKEKDLRSKLREVWSKPRNKDWYKPTEADAPTHTVLSVRRNVPFGSVPLLAEQVQTVVFQPRVVQAKLKGLWFSTSKCFLLPTARHSLQCIKDLYDANPDTDLLVVGHTDTAGNASYNDPLSLERAEAVVAYLKDDVDAWYAWYGSDKASEKRWGATEDREMIRALAEEAGEHIPIGTTEVRWYQDSRGLGGSGTADESTRKALLKEYMGLDGTTLPESIKPVAHGCGENFPAQATGDGVSAQENRRVEIFFFDNPVAPPDRPDAVLPPPPATNSKAGSKEYPEWVKRVTERHEFEAGHWIRLLMRYEDGEPAKNVPFLIRYADGNTDRQTTTDAGLLIIHGVREQQWSITGVEDASVITSFQ